MRRVLAVMTLTFAAVLHAPTAQATMWYGNYQVHVPDRFDFHTIIWWTAFCIGYPQGSDCRHITNVPQPIAKADSWVGEAHLVNGRYEMTVDDPFGLRCGNVYYGPVIPTRDVYRWDPNTLAGTLESSFAAGCDNAPGGTHTYPIWLTRL